MPAGSSSRGQVGRDRHHHPEHRRDGGEDARGRRGRRGRAACGSARAAAVVEVEQRRPVERDHRRVVVVRRRRLGGGRRRLGRAAGPAARRGAWAGARRRSAWCAWGPRPAARRGAPRCCGPRAAPRRGRPRARARSPAAPPARPREAFAWRCRLDRGSVALGFAHVTGDGARRPGGHRTLPGVRRSAASGRVSEPRGSVPREGRDISIGPDGRTRLRGRADRGPPRPQRRRLPARRARSRERLADGPAAARQARARPDGARPPPRPHGRAHEAARVPGRRPRRRADRRRLHRARRRPVGPLGHAARPVGRADRRERRDLPAPGRQGPARRRRALEVRRNAEWLDMSMEDLFRLARHPTVAQLLERDDFAKRFAADEPISLLELLYPVLQGYDSVAVRGRRRARRHRPDVQPADGPLDPAGLRPAAADRAHDAAADRHRRRAEDVEVVRQPHRRHRARRPRCTARRCGSPTSRSRRGSRCCSATSRRRARARATPSARSRARS